MTTMPQPLAPTSSFTAVYDAWNRLVALKDGSNFVNKMEYDGLNRRVVKEKYVSGSLDETRHYYYSTTWQVLEETVESGGSETRESQFIWGVRYVDDLILRDRDADSNSGTGSFGSFGGVGAGAGLEERLYALTVVTGTQKSGVSEPEALRVFNFLYFGELP